MKSSANYVIAIAGPAGAGKSTLVKEVTELLVDAVPFYFDHYDFEHQGPDDLAKWIKDGADPKVWKRPQLLRDLHALKRGESVELPGDRGILEPAEFIVMEEPFGRGRTKMAECVDFVACIDLPAEVALARKVLRDMSTIAEDEKGQPPQRCLDRITNHIDSHLEWYLHSFGREMYTVVNDGVLRNCDLVLDGMRSPDELATDIVRTLKIEIDGSKKSQVE